MEQQATESPTTNKEVYYMIQKYIIILLAFLLLIFSACGKREWKNPFDTEVEIQPPAGFTATPISDSQIQITWQKSEDVKTCYIIERREQVENNYQLLIEVGHNISSYTDTALTIDTEYYYRLKGKSGENVTNVKQAYNHTTFIEISNFSIKQENIFTAELTWTHNCNYEEGYVLERKEVVQSSRLVTSVTQASSLVRKETQPSPIKNNIPQAKDVTQLSPIAKDFRQKIQNSSVNLYPDYYPDEESQKEKDNFIVIDTLPPDANNYIDNTLTPNHSHEYRIKAFTIYNESNYQNQWINMAIPKPTNFSCYQQDVHTFELTWQDNSIGEEGFIIERKIDNGNWITITLPPNDTTYICVLHNS